MSAAGPEPACAECAARGILLSDLAAHIDRSVAGRAGARARDLLALSDERLAQAVSPGDAGAALRRARSPAAYQVLLDRLAGRGCWSTCVHRDEYPASLRTLGPARPRALFGGGAGAALAAAELDRTVTIVGSRRAGPYGREVAAELARLLAATGITVVSGLALGIDAAAHEGALDGGGTTVAILGTGPERSYPRSNHRLFARIRETGAVLSELPPGSATFRWMFPARNRIMAALAALTIVVEAAERSGSLITAEMAIEGGRQVGAVPGPVNSWRSGGTNRLLADGAAVIRDARDALDLLLGPGVELAPPRGPLPDPSGRAVLSAIEAGATTPGAAASAAGLPFRQAQAALGRLERDGYVRSDAAGRYARTALRAPDR